VSIVPQQQQQQQQQQIISIGRTRTDIEAGVGDKKLKPSLKSDKDFL
jgi:hypothetical protein